MDAKYILTEKQDGITTVILNDPKKMNAFSQALGWELGDVLEALSYDAETRVVIIRGAGGNFCGGGDIKYMKDKMDRLKAGLPLAVDPILNMRKLNHIITLIRQMSKPVIAWLEGAVAGAGVSLAMSCDFSIAEENAKLLFAFVNVGLMPDMGSTYMLTRRVGFPKASELFMTGKPFSGEEAAEWGIITDALSSDEVEARVMKLAKKLSQGPSQAYADIKSMINQCIYRGLEESMSQEIEYQNILNKTADHIEAVSAFLEKRRPTFCGK